MRHSLLLLLCLASPAFPSVVRQRFSTRDADLQSSTRDGSDVKALAAACNEFSFSLFNRLALMSGEENMFASPFSVSTGLSLLLLGARTTSDAELRSGLKLDPIVETDGRTVHHLFHELISSRIAGNPSLALSNYLLVQKATSDNPILDKYKSDVRSLYSADIDDVDFEGDGDRIEEDVNAWVKKRTGGLMERMLTVAPSPDTKAILMNAIFFKGKWRQPFDASLTTPLTFFNRGVNERETPFMQSYAQRLPHKRITIAGEPVQVLEVPFANASTSMLIVLPEKMNGLDEITLSESFNSDMRTVLASMNEVRTESPVNVRIPKFEILEMYSLKSTLMNMGVTSIFTPTVADLSGINGQRNLAVSQVKHKAYIRVDEEGVEAAAVTAVMVAAPSAPPPAFEFRADHPFLFMIKDRQTGLILFIGKVEQF